MTRASPIADAIRRAKEKRRLKPIVDLLRMGFEPTAEEWDMLAAVAVNGGRKTDPKTEEKLDEKRALVARVDDLEESLGLEGALEHVASECQYTAEYLRWLREGHDNRL